MEDMGDGLTPAGTLMTNDITYTEDAGLQNALGAPNKTLVIATGRGDEPPRAGKIHRLADQILAQLLKQIGTAFALLDRMSSDAASVKDRVNAQERLELLSAWITRSILWRSGRDAAEPLEVPESVARWAAELSSLGRRLKFYMRAAGLGSSSTAVSRKQAPPIEPDPLDSAPLTRPERTLLEALADLTPGDGLTGSRLLLELCERRVHGISQSKLTSRLIPGLRGREWDLPNRRGVGYFLSKSDRTLFAKLDTRSSI